MRVVWQDILSIAILFLLVGHPIVAQTSVIVLDNPSFEDMPRHSHTPRFWKNCGFPNESAPDVQPDYTFQVSKRAVDGNTYLGMVVRDNDTWESVGQLMSRPLQKDKCYSFSIKLSRSLSYLSVSRELNEPANYITPTKLRIWAGFGMCDKRFLLGESYLVRHADWKMYEFMFEPDAAYTHIIFEAFYQTPTLFPYNGNLLLDDASVMEPIPCDTEVIEGPQDYLPEPLAVNDPPNHTFDPPIAAVDPNPKTTPKGPGTSTNEPTLGGVKRADMVSGETTILLEDLQFEADSSRVIQSSMKALDELYQFLLANDDVKIEVGGHTNGWAEADYGLNLSRARAKSVADYLIRKGINRGRIVYKGYGKENPIDTNESAAGRRRNQRVEIKIL